MNLSQKEHNETITQMIKEQKKSLNAKTKLYKEENNRNEMTELSRSLQQNVTKKLEERLLEGIRTMRHIVFDSYQKENVTNCYPKLITSTQRDLLKSSTKTAARNINFQWFQNISNTMTSKHNCYRNVQLSNHQRNQITLINIITRATRGDILMTNLKIKTEGQFTEGKRLMGFLEANEGMTIKQRVELKEHKLAFGYTRPNRFCQKRWGFFRPPTPNY